MYMKDKKRVAFLSFDWDYEIVAEYYRGMQAFLNDECGDLQLVVLSAFGHYHIRFEPDSGAHKVFTLCNPEKYDGFIVQGNRAWAPELRQEFVDMAVALGKPVVSINYSLKGAHVVGTNNYDAMYGLVDRILEDRGCTDPAFVNGLATSGEAQARAQAFYDACAAHGVEHPRFYQASWQIEDGRQMANELLESGNSLPEVIICCNDDLAIGIQETLQKHGVRVPEDVMITGFDNREIGRCVTPCITTVDRDYFNVGRTALGTVRRLLEGENVPAEVFSPVQYCLRESAAYDTDASPISMTELYSLDNSLKRFYEVLNNFQSAVNQTKSLNDILDICEHFMGEVRCTGVYVNINDTYLQFDAEQDLTSYAPISHLMAKVGTRALPPCNSRHVYTSFPADDILPDILSSDAPMYVVYPLQRGEVCIGTLVTEGLSPIMSHGFLTFCITMLSSGIENVRTKELLRAANARLDDLYVHDELTGLFNRFGLERFGLIAYEHLLRDFGAAQFIFVDIDNMKGINDKFGHEAGDCAIHETADIIRRASMGENAFSMRYGGDEFLLICRNDITNRIEAELNLLRRSVMEPYELGLSIGAYEVRTEDHLTMEEAIKNADDKMYEIKKLRKIKRGAV